MISVFILYQNIFLKAKNRAGDVRKPHYPRNQKKGRLWTIKNYLISYLWKMRNAKQSVSMRKRAGTAPTIAYRVRTTAPLIMGHNNFIHFSLAFFMCRAIMIVGKGYELISIQTKTKPR